MNRVKKRPIPLKIIFIFILISLYLIFLFVFYVIMPRKVISFILILGIAIITFSFSFFFYLESNEYFSKGFKLKIISENDIKIILLLLFLLSLFIPPITSKEVIILWSKISFINYVKAIFVIISSLFLPGANLYNIIFTQQNLHNKFNVKSYILKLTLYPLISFSFIGFSVLIFDQMGFLKNYFLIYLFLLILILFFTDFLIQAIRRKSINFNIITIKISKSELIILIFALGFMFISIGIYLANSYLAPGDSWIGAAPTSYIGEKNTSPIKWSKKHLNYPMFWSYICFGLSILSGIPYFNINALICPFGYLFITSIYLFNKAILSNFEDKYAIFSTFLIVLFSQIFHVSFEFSSAQITGLIAPENFLYKNYAFLLFFLVLAMYIVLLKDSSNYDFKDYNFFKSDEFKEIILCAFLLILSFITYMIPFLIGMIFIISYSFYTNYKKEALKLLKIFLFFINLIFILVDFFMEFHLSSSIFYIIFWIFAVGELSSIFGVIPTSIIIYIMLNFIFFIIIIFQIYFTKLIEKEEIRFRNKKINFNNIFKILLIIFTIFLFFEILIIVFIQFKIFIDEINTITFFYYLNFIMLKLGFTGILAIYLIKINYRTNNRILFILVNWLILVFSISIVIMLLYVVNTQSLIFYRLDRQQEFSVEMWLTRNFYYSVIPLSILCAIGLFKLMEKVKNVKIRTRILYPINRNHYLKYLFIFFFIYLSFSNFFIYSINMGDRNNRPKDEQVELLSWMSENIPSEKGFIIEDNYIIRVGIYSIVNGYYSFIDDVFDTDNSLTENIDDIDNLIGNEIEYLLITKEYLEDTSNQSIFIRDYLIPNFYNKSLYRSHNYRLYYSLYFDNY